MPNEAFYLSCPRPFGSQAFYLASPKHMYLACPKHVYLGNPKYLYLASPKRIYLACPRKTTSTSAEEAVKEVEA